MEQCLSLVHQDLMMSEYDQSHNVLVKLISLHGRVSLIGASGHNDDCMTNHISL